MLWEKCWTSYHLPQNGSG